VGGVQRNARRKKTQQTKPKIMLYLVILWRGVVAGKKDRPQNDISSIRTKKKSKLLKKQIKQQMKGSKLLKLGKTAIIPIFDKTQRKQLLKKRDPSSNFKAS